MNDITVSKSFEERMFDQIKSQMGELLTADELKAILEKSINKAFFSERKETSGYHSKTIEPLFAEMIRKELKPLVEAGAQQWLAENQDKVGEILKEQIGANAAQFVAHAFTNMMHQPMQQFSFELQEKLRGVGIPILECMRMSDAVDKDVIAYTDDEMEEFKELIDMTGSSDQMDRIEARLDTPKFVEKHGKSKCDYMYSLIDNEDGTYADLKNDYNQTEKDLQREV